MKKIFSVLIIVLLFAPYLCFSQSFGGSGSDNNVKYNLGYESVGTNIGKLSGFLKNYVTMTTGADSLLIVVITGSSIFGAHNITYGITDTTTNPPGQWSNMQGARLLDSLQYSRSNLAYYSRSNAGYTYNGTWDYSASQWTAIDHKRYRESYGNAAYVEIDISNAEHFAVIYEAKTDGDEITITFDETAPSVLGFTGGGDTFDTERVADYLPFGTTYYHGLDSTVTYTVRMTKSVDTEKAFKFWGCMKWTYASIHLVTTARSGQGDNQAQSNYYCNVSYLSPDLTIFQTHDVNEGNTWNPSGLYDTMDAMTDSAATYSHSTLYIIPFRTYAYDQNRIDNANGVRILLAEENQAVIDMAAYNTINTVAQTNISYDGTHPNSAGIQLYVNEILKVLKLKKY